MADKSINEKESAPAFAARQRAGISPDQSQPFLACDGRTVLLCLLLALLIGLLTTSGAKSPVNSMLPAEEIGAASGNAAGVAASLNTAPSFVTEDMPAEEGSDSPDGDGSGSPEGDGSGSPEGDGSGSPEGDESDSPRDNGGESSAEGDKLIDQVLNELEHVVEEIALEESTPGEDPEVGIAKLDLLLAGSGAAADSEPAADPAAPSASEAADEEAESAAAEGKPPKPRCEGCTKAAEAALQLCPIVPAKRGVEPEGCAGKGLKPLPLKFVDMLNQVGSPKFQDPRTTPYKVHDVYSPPILHAFSDVHLARRGEPIPFDYSSCAVVGSSATLKGKKFGEKINSYRTIIRFNKAPTKKYQEDVGNRTTLRIQNALHCGFREKDEYCMLHPAQIKMNPLCKKAQVKAGCRGVQVSAQMSEFTTKYWTKGDKKTRDKWFNIRKSEPECTAYLFGKRMPGRVLDRMKEAEKKKKGRGSGKSYSQIKNKLEYKCEQRISGGLWGILLALNLCERVGVFGFPLSSGSSGGHYYTWKGGPRAHGMSAADLWKKRHHWKLEKNLLKELKAFSDNSFHERLEIFA